MVHDFMEVKFSFQRAPVGVTLGLRWGNLKRCCFILVIVIMHTKLKNNTMVDQYLWPIHTMWTCNWISWWSFWLLVFFRNIESLANFPFLRESLLIFSCFSLAHGLNHFASPSHKDCPSLQEENTCWNSISLMANSLNLKLQVYFLPIWYLIGEKGSR